MRRPLIGLVVVVLVGAYVLGAPKVGLAWPWPLVLPDKTHLRGAWYDRSGECVGDRGVGGRGWLRVGEMWTALGPIGRPVLAAPRSEERAASLYLIAVRDGGCYRVYRLGHVPAP
jgi:hypothetical protein